MHFLNSLKIKFLGVGFLGRGGGTYKLHIGHAKDISTGAAFGRPRWCNLKMAYVQLVCAPSPPTKVDHFKVIFLLFVE